MHQGEHDDMSRARNQREETVRLEAIRVEVAEATRVGVADATRFELKTLGVRPQKESTAFGSRT